MLAVLDDNADAAAVGAIMRGLGLWTQRYQDSAGATCLAIVPPSQAVDAEVLAAVPGVARVLQAASATPLVDAQFGRSVRVGGVTLGSNCALFAGPCAAESESQVHAAAVMAAMSGAVVLRGGAFKPRTSPYAFSGHGLVALQWLRDAADANGLALVTEVMAVAHLDAVANAAEMLQVGSRNMQNYSLLRAVGEVGKPVLLKRGAAATLDEWLQAGEHLLAAGAGHVVFCERGVRSVGRDTRNMLDLGAVALLKHVRGQTVVVDPSHAAGRRDLVIPLAMAARAVGADAVMVECHPHPSQALSDGAQALDSEEMARLATALNAANVEMTTHRRALDGTGSAYA